MSSEQEQVDNVNRISDRLLQVILTEFGSQEPDVVLIAIIDTGIKACKGCHLDQTNVQACERLLRTIEVIRREETRLEFSLARHN